MSLPKIDRCSVVLAGGGSAGHIEPALALADALRRRDPRIRDHLPRHRRGPGHQADPGARLPARADPGRAAAAQAHHGRASPCPPGWPGRVRRAAEVLDKAAADVVVGFGGYVSLPAYFAARRRGVPIVVHEANVRPGLANRVGARMTDSDRHRLAAHCRLPRRPATSACRCGDDRQPGPAGAAGRGPRVLRPAARPPVTLLVYRRLAGRAPAQRGRDRGARAGSGPAGRADAARGRPRQLDARTRARSPAPRTCACPTWTGWTWRTPPPTWCCAGAA